MDTWTRGTSSSNRLLEGFQNQSHLRCLKHQPHRHQIRGSGMGQAYPWTKNLKILTQQQTSDKNQSDLKWMKVDGTLMVKMTKRAKEQRLELQPQPSIFGI